MTQLAEAASEHSDGLITMEPQSPIAVPPRRRHLKILLLLFFVTLPLLNPWVRGDGVGYYAYIRSMLVEHRMDFTKDWLAGNDTFTMNRIKADGTIDSNQYTRTGQIDNHWAVGASILWAPFEIPVHLAMLTLQKFGAHVKADGFSRPYIVTMALATALYGFLGLIISFRFACFYVEEQWAFLATLGIWFASSLPVYMYFNPSWSHAQSVFVVAVFLYYWQVTRHERTLTQWIILGLISGLVLDVHYLNIAVLLVPLLESLQGYWRGWRAPGHDWRAMLRLFGANVLYSCAIAVAFLPTLVTRQIIYGNPFNLGYAETAAFQWGSPHCLSVLLSSDHGLLLWTPIVILSVLGFFILLRRNRTLAVYSTIVFVALCYIIGGHVDWDGLSSFGNRYFIALTPLYVLGLAATFSEIANWVKRPRQAMLIARSLTVLFVVWNLAFIFQWGTHMVPARGPISWNQMVHNQFVAVPQRATSQLAAYFGNRRALMHHIEQEDVHQLQEQQKAGNTQ